MRIVTWNCCRGPFAAKTAFARELAPDVAVLQECARPAEESSAARWAGENPAQGIAVLAGDGYAVEPIEPAPEAPRWIVPFRVTGPRGFTLLAVWTLPQPTYTATLCRGIEAYAELLAAGPSVVAGDFNSNSSLDRPRSPYGHARAVGLLGELGLASAYHAFHSEEHGAETRPTYYHLWRREQPFHLDYCFIPREWLPAITDVRVGSFDEWIGRSDHRPVIVDML